MGMLWNDDSPDNPLCGGDGECLYHDDPRLNELRAELYSAQAVIDATSSALEVLTVFVLSEMAPEFSQTDKPAAEAGRAVWRRHRDEAAGALDTFSAALAAHLERYPQ